ncbi:hypothetical protein AKO1_003746 [Acrasis kona]|uniref:Zn(2)-C6 fungal-type domain-containing protein n=1 Tax=Acrasis kona TaxID=1008807 RepID=A0AAW2YV59_9EUKA
MSQMLSAKSCLNCRKLHRKCDRRTPRCTLCSERRKTCVYENVVEVREDVRRTSISSLSGINLDMSNSKLPLPLVNLQYTRNHTHNPLQHFMPTINLSSGHKFINLLQGLSLEIMLSTPVMSRDKLIEVLQYLDLQQTGQEHLASPPHWEDMAFVYALLACFYKKDGNQALSHQLFELCRNLINSNDFERVSTSFVAACCFQYLGSYCTLEENTARAEFFLSNVRGYLENQRGKVLHPCHSFLESSHVIIKLFSFLCDGTREPEHLHGMFEIFVSKFLALKEFYSTDFGKFISHDRRITDVFANMEMKYGMEDIKLYIRDIYREDDVAAYICDQFMNAFDQVMNIMPHPHVHFRKLTGSFSFQAYRLVRSIVVNDSKTSRSVADNIAKMLSTTDFSHCFMVIADVIYLVSDYHIKCIETSTDPLDQLLLLSSLREEYAAVTYLDERYFKTKIATAKQKLEIALAKYNGLMNSQNYRNQMNTRQQIPTGQPVLSSGYNFENTFSNFASAVGANRNTQPLTPSQPIPQKQLQPHLNYAQVQLLSTKQKVNFEKDQGGLLYELSDSLQDVGDLLSYDTVEDVFTSFM